MNADDYLPEAETTYCKVDAEIGDSETSKEGEFVCTENRVVFIQQNKRINPEILDISLDSIDIIKYNPSLFRLDYLIGALISLAGAWITWEFHNEFSILEIPGPFLSELGPLFALIFLLVGVALIYTLLKLRSPTIILKTSVGVYTFRSKDKKALSQFPHAIRGAVASHN